jgi:hypothetical protein
VKCYKHNQEAQSILHTMFALGKICEDTGTLTIHREAKCSCNWW